MENELKQILCVTTPETTINYRWEKDSHLIDESRVRIVDLETIKSMEARGIKFERECATITEGMVFGLHPYEQNCYIDLAMHESKILDRKASLLADFCKYLGVTSIDFEAKLEQEIIRNMGGGIAAGLDVATVATAAMGGGGLDVAAGAAAGGLDVPVDLKVEAGLDLNKQRANKDLERYARKKTFSGEFSIEDYEKAKEEYKRIGYNYELEHFLKQRNPNDSNKLLSEKMIIELSSEMNDLTDIAFKLMAMKDIFKLNANFVKNVSIKRTIRYEMTLNFSA